MKRKGKKKPVKSKKTTEERPEEGKNTKKKRSRDKEGDEQEHDARFPVSRATKKRYIIRAGGVRMAEEALDELSVQGRERADKVVSLAARIAAYNHRRTISAADMTKAMKMEDIRVY